MNFLHIKNHAIRIRLPIRFIRKAFQKIEQTFRWDETILPYVIYFVMKIDWKITGMIMNKLWRRLVINSIVRWRFLVGWLMRLRSSWGLNQVVRWINSHLNKNWQHKIASNPTTTRSHKPHQWTNSPWSNLSTNLNIV